MSRLSLEKTLVGEQGKDVGWVKESDIEQFRLSTLARDGRVFLGVE
jgi:hypothetical protein